VSLRLARCKDEVIAHPTHNRIASGAYSYAARMNVMLSLSFLIQGLVGGVLTLVVLAARAAIEGRSGVTFADLWTALAVGVAVGIVPVLISRIVVWRMRRVFGAGSQGQWTTSSTLSHGRRDHRPDESSARSTSGVDGFGKFTDRARRVLTYAQDEAQRFDHNYIGTEHLLLGLIREGNGMAAQVLENMGVELAKVRTAVDFIIGRGDQAVVGEVGLTPRAKRVIELAIDEAHGFGHNYIGTEHLLLGLVREGEGIAAGVLESLGVNLDRVRHEVIRALGKGGDPR